MSQDATHIDDAFNPGNPAHRHRIIDLMRQFTEQGHPGDWNDRCGYVAFYGVQTLNQVASGYRVAAGRVENIAVDPPEVLYEGTYTGSGGSNYHVWIVGPNGEQIDCTTRVPGFAGAPHLWEPYERIPTVVDRPP